MTHDATHPATAAHGSHAGGHDDHHDHGIGQFVVVFVALMVLLIATVGAAYINMGALNVPVAFLIASVKAALILWFFMHLKFSTRLTQVFAFASFAWLVLMVLITLGDYFSRNMLALNRAEERTHLRKVDSYPVNSGISRSALPGSPEHNNPHGVEGEARPEVKKGSGHGN